jgi:hypothetical protein
MNAPLRDPLSDLRLIGISLTPAEAALTESLPVVLHSPTYEALFRLGVRGVALTGADAFDALHIEVVCFLQDGRFEFARDIRDQVEGALAVIIPCRDEFGRTTDLAAWHMDTGRVATWLGAAVMLGEDNISAPRIDCDGVRVFPDAAAWLREDRRGVVILDATRARWRLTEERLIVREADIDFGRRLRKILRLPEPRIFVETAKVAA